MENNIEMNVVVYTYLRYELQLIHCNMDLIRGFSA